MSKPFGQSNVDSFTLKKCFSRANKSIPAPEESLEFKALKLKKQTIIYVLPFFDRQIVNEFSSDRS